MSRKRKHKLHLDAHAGRRLEERYGIANYDAAMRNRIVADIQNQRGEFLWRDSLNRAHWKIQIEGRPVHVVYDLKRHAIATFLPLEGM
jgi:hypothetical protein